MYDYIMLLYCEKEDKITYELCAQSYMFFIEYPVSEKNYDDPEEVLDIQMKLSSQDAGIIYEMKKGKYKQIAFIDRRKND